MKILYSMKGIYSDVLDLLRNHEVYMLSNEEMLTQFKAKGHYNVVLFEGKTHDISKILLMDPQIEIVLFGTGEDAIEAIRQGAAAYYEMPIDDETLERLEGTISGISENILHQHETYELEKLLISKYTFGTVVGQSPKMLEIFSFIKRMAPYYKVVTLTGETGVGKEVIARAIHAASPVADKPFIVCNCAGLVEGLIESELFGHKKGSFTGAVADKIGLFETAGEGTIFLDEIGDVPLTFQAHLLRVLQDGDYRKVGSNQIHRARCRVVTATNKNLEAEVKKGNFRDDLYYRLSSIVIDIPPLRDRKEDILLLCKHIIEKFRQRTNKAVFGLSKSAQAAIMNHMWPGNVRDLENVIERAAIVTPSSLIRLQDLPPHIRDTNTANMDTHPTSLANAEKSHIENMLKLYKGNRTKTAKILEISRRALIRKIQKFDIQ